MAGYHDVRTPYEQVLDEKDAEIDRLRAELAFMRGHGIVQDNERLKAELAEAKARIAELDRDIAAKAHNLTYLNARAERAEAELKAMREALELLLNEAGRMANATCMIVAMDKARAALAPSTAGDRQDALLYNAESQYCAGMSFGFELGRNDDRAELSRIITQRWKEIADAKALAALAPSPADKDQDNE